MPIYAYKCDACGHAKDVLQKMSDPQLTDCPACGKATFKKQLTAAGFQLKGTGWYVTDFREGSGKNSAPAVDPKIGSTEAATASTTSTLAAETSTGSSPVASTQTATPAASPVTAAPVSVVSSGVSSA
jgi:putative FmdB family regulatory protein